MMAMAMARVHAHLVDFVDEIDGVLREIDSVTERDDEELLESLLLQASLVLRDTLVVEDLLPDGEVLSDALCSVVRCLQEAVDEKNLSHLKGRPAICIPEEQLAMLLGYHFKVTDIARILMVSPRTIRRRIIQYGLENEASYSNISDDDLDSLSLNFVHHNPNSGLRSLEGILRSRGIRIQRQRVRESLMRVDPRGMQARFGMLVQRRKYAVPLPNSLWHIDGHHKLIRWRIVTHGCIDGFSRLPLYLQASTNNRAQTVLELFVKAVQQYGLPSRVRCDKGGENVDVSQFMLCHPSRGPGRRSCITGRSVHNQRIERLWRDVFSGCIHMFHNLFYTMEESGILDPASNSDLFCLHYIFLPRINEQLRLFKESYSHHRLRGAGNQSPYQLWIGGLAAASDSSAEVQGVEDPVTVSVSQSY